MSTCAMLLRKDIENIRRIVKKKKENEEAYVGLVQDSRGFCSRRDMRTWFYGGWASGAAKELEGRP